MKQNKQFTYVYFQINISFIKSKYNIIHMLNFDICLKSCFIHVVNCIPIPPSFSLWGHFHLIPNNVGEKKDATYWNNNNNNNNNEFYYKKVFIINYECVCIYIF
jgi:hypothetical protein